jgi:hypothetical protein
MEIGEIENMIDFITQHPVISVIAFIIATKFVYSTIRLFVRSFSRKGGKGRKSMSTTIVNGKKYCIPGCHSISAINNKVFVDGKPYQDPEDGELIAEVINITIEGDVTGNVVNESGNIDCGNVGGSVKTASGDISCNDVTGDASTASGDIKAKSIQGSCRTISGDIIH